MLRNKHHHANRHDPARRRLAGAFGLAALAAPGLLRAMATTPRQSRGPFYPERIPLDSDNDLVMVEGVSQPARGEVVHVSGQVLDARGAPLQGAKVEIWQCDGFGRYHHPGDRGRGPIDPGFQGYGHTLTDADGGYRFRTIHPVPYPGRAPHIHFAVHWQGRERLVTQMYVRGAIENQTDFLLGRLASEQRAALLVDFRPSERFNGQKHGRFDLVIAV